jgi:hypothetical protein
VAKKGQSDNDRLGRSEIEGVIAKWDIQYYVAQPLARVWLPVSPESSRRCESPKHNYLARTTLMVDARATTENGVVHTFGQDVFSFGIEGVADGVVKEPNRIIETYLLARIK